MEFVRTLLSLIERETDYVWLSGNKPTDFIPSSGCECITIIFTGAHHIGYANGNVGADTTVNEFIEKVNSGC
jgi:hypothetical protein